LITFTEKIKKNETNISNIYHGGLCIYVRSGCTDQKCNLFARIREEGVLN
jgi:hypothetical protein